MKKTHSVAWAVMAVVAMFCLILLSGGRTAEADTIYNVSGDATRATSFTVQAWGSATVTLRQDYGFFRYTSGSTGRAWGRFHVDVVRNGGTQRLEWDNTVGETLILTLNSSGTYRVTVTPWTASEINAQISGFSAWTQLPTWSVTGASNCSVSNQGTVTAAPTATSRVCTVYYRDAYGNTLQSFNRYCTVGTNTVTAPATLQGGAYTLISASSQTVTGYSNGTVSPKSVVFYYAKASTATPRPTTATVTVYYRTYAGSLLQSHQVTVTQGNNTITAPATLQNGTYSLVSSATQNVTLYANGSLSLSSVTFYYDRTATPTPTPPSTATVTVYYCDAGGSVLQTRQVTVSRGTNTVSAPATIDSGRYTLISGSSQSVTLYSNGTLSVSSLVFYYQRSATPTPVPPSTATVTVYYCDANGSTLQTRQVTVSRGTNTITAPSTLDNGSYTLISGASQSVTLYSNGSLSASSVTFYYSRVNNVTATVTVRLIDVDTMSTLSTRYETLGVGTHTIYAGSTPSGYRAYSETSATVTVYADGTVSRGLITFEYKRQTPVTNPPVTQAPVPAGNVVYPTNWDTQFGPESKNPEGRSNLHRICDNDPSTVLSHIHWDREVKDPIPEFTVTFGGSTVSAIGVTNGIASSYDRYTANARPSSMRLRIYHSGGVTDCVIELPKGYNGSMKTYSLGGTFTGVTKIEIFVEHVWLGDSNRYNVNIAEIAFFE